ncbi:hypothetical protein [Thermovirga sp.]|uniref:hypothetical protein n=1 Tax=Thermovirga sp. TaxID=2699834 RepID=UPI0025F84F9F|nr:hypothetical protein [Thermovirga sp.]MBO8154742.1 hypothetical protein [Thermovirga sp.]MCD6184118.1 hypothetical protein [Thermovirga sp.]
MASFQQGEFRDGSDSGTKLPTAGEMATCLRDPARKSQLEERIIKYYISLRKKVPKPPKADAGLIKEYSRIMAKLREEEETLLEMLDAFALGDATKVRTLSERLTKEVWKSNNCYNSSSEN